MAFKSPAQMLRLLEGWYDLEPFSNLSWNLWMEILGGCDAAVLSCHILRLRLLAGKEHSLIHVVGFALVPRWLYSFGCRLQDTLGGDTPSISNLIILDPVLGLLLHIWACIRGWTPYAASRDQWQEGLGFLDLWGSLGFGFLSCCHALTAGLLEPMLNVWVFVLGGSFLWTAKRWSPFVGICHHPKPNEALYFNETHGANKQTVGLNWSKEWISSLQRTQCHKESGLLAKKVVWLPGQHSDGFACWLVISRKGWPTDIYALPETSSRHFSERPRRMLDKIMDVVWSHDEFCLL